MITIVTAWYNFSNKYGISNYRNWIDNFLGNANCNIIIFTNIDSILMLQDYITKPNIYIIIKEITDFLTYKYSSYWKKDLLSSDNPLKGKISWEVNMLWNEKINFVKHAMDINRFNTEMYAWCDIGYFRCRPNVDINKEQIRKWPNMDIIKTLNKDKIYYNMANKLRSYTSIIYKMARTRNKFDLPEVPIPHDQYSISGGFFVIHKNKIDFWHNLYYNRLYKYLKYNYLVKDDQIILIDCIVNNASHFKVIEQEDEDKDLWFTFSTYLL